MQTNFDRTITLALILTIIVETAGALLWAGTMDHRVETLEIVAELRRPIDRRLTRLEVQVMNIRDTLARIEADLSDVEEDLDD